MKTTTALLLIVLILTTGCMLGPDYKRPETNPPQAFMESAPPGESIANMAWWELFKDEQLQELIRIALRENRDVLASAARIQQARAALGYTKAEQWPSIVYGGKASQSSLLSPNFLYPLAPRHLDPYVYVKSNDSIVAADASFELDLWGRLRRSTEAATADLAASEEAYRTVTITLVSDVATTYLLLRQLDAQEKTATDTLASRRESRKLIQAKFDAGLVPLLDVNQAQMLESSAATTLASIERGKGETEHALSYLLGRVPGPIPRGAALDAQVFPPEVPAGLPAELLDRRPDIRMAEEALHAETAIIGVAKAAMLPNITLTGTYGFESIQLTGYNTGIGNFWSLGASLVGPLFQFGKNVRRVEIQKAKAEEALRNYENTVLNSLREVENGLVAVRTYRDQYAAVVRDVEAARSASKLCHARYDAGYSSYLEVLDTDRILFDTELQAAAVLQQRYAAVIGLYKALGGGWPVEPAQQGAQGGETKR
jgi:multidrug efflux system outer membrane protein